MFYFLKVMQISLLNKPNIFIQKTSYLPNYQTNVKKQKFNSTNDMFVKTHPAFTGNIEELLIPFHKFEIAEYRSLRTQKIQEMRSQIDSRLIEHRNAAIILSNIVKKNLDKLYPNGYVFASIGRSPAVIGKALEYQGNKVKYCPISNLGRVPSVYDGFLDKVSNLPTEKVQKYKEYLNSINLTEQEIKNTQNTYVFTDFCGSGDSLKNFQLLLERPEINLKSENIHYKALNKDILLNESTQDMSIRFEGGQYNIDEFIYKYLQQLGFKLEVYPHIRRLPYENLDEIQEIMKKPYYRGSKKMNFALIDYFAQKGLLKE